MRSLSAGWHAPGRAERQGIEHPGAPRAGPTSEAPAPVSVHANATGASGEPGRAAPALATSAPCRARSGGHPGPHAIRDIVESPARVRAGARRPGDQHGTFARGGDAGRSERLTRSFRRRALTVSSARSGLAAMSSSKAYARAAGHIGTNRPSLRRLRRYKCRSGTQRRRASLEATRTARHSAYSVA